MTNSSQEIAGSRTRNFIDRQAFEDALQSAGRVDGEPYADVPTIYGDLSRLVVAFCASRSPEQLRALYSELGWGGSANVRAIHVAAKTWMDQHRNGCS